MIAGEWLILLAVKHVLGSAFDDTQMFGFGFCCVTQ